MENKINIAELLEGCPKGMELYSPVCGKCNFSFIQFADSTIKVSNKTGVYYFAKDGTYTRAIDAECLLFPSKDNRDWSKFVPPCKFKDGDVLVHTQNGRFIMSIYKSNENEKLINTHVIFWDRNLNTFRLCLAQNIQSSSIMWLKK